MIRNLLTDLYISFYLAKKHKSSKEYIERYKKNLHSNLVSIRDELWERRYSAMPSVCFIIEEPKKREIFAADFRDRIVHHLYFEYTHKIFEKTFIHDSYSCIKGRGTHFGISRLDHHIKAESLNYTRPCYILKLDIKGYFMAIHRPTLLGIAKKTLEKNKVDDLIMYLTEKIIMLNPTENCIKISSDKEYEGLPSSKTLFKSKKDCGLPIGNLTSQLFSNVYLNVFDQYMKRDLGCKHYGRYVDDAYVVSHDKEFLLYVREKAKEFLKETLRLELHEGKSNIYDAYNGVEFLGAYIKPNRIYVSNQSVSRMRRNVRKDPSKRLQAAISRHGVLSHYNSFSINEQLFLEGVL